MATVASVAGEVKHARFSIRGLVLSRALSAPCRLALLTTRDSRLTTSFALPELPGIVLPIWRMCETSCHGRMGLEVNHAKLTGKSFERISKARG
jgi:hypothetical protein